MGYLTFNELGQNVFGKGFGNDLSNKLELLFVSDLLFGVFCR
jgi:hypothetical protein